MPKWSAAIDTAAKGVPKDPVILCFGDSKTWGQGSLGSSTSNNAKTASYPTVLAGYKFGGLNAQWAFEASGNQGALPAANLALGDTRFVLGAGGVTAGGAGFESIGAYSMPDNSLGAMFSFTPIEQVDTFEVYYFQQLAGGVFGLQISSGSVQNVNTGSTPNDYKKAVITGALGLNTINLSWVFGGNVIIYQIVAYNWQQRNVRVYNAGVPSATAALFTTNTSAASNPLNAFNDLA